MKTPYTCKGIEIHDDLIKHTVDAPSWVWMDKTLKANPDLGSLDQFWDRYKVRVDKEIAEALKYGRTS